MSAKYQTPYVKVSDWANFLQIGLYEDAVKEALENRGFEIDDIIEGEYDYFKIYFE